MGGQAIRHEPEDTMQVQCHSDVWQVFQNAGWDTYFERLQGFDEAVTVEFMFSLERNYYRVHGLEIPITEEVILTISRLPQGG